MDPRQMPPSTGNWPCYGGHSILGRQLLPRGSPPCRQCPCSRRTISARASLSTMLSLQSCALCRKKSGRSAPSPITLAAARARSWRFRWHRVDLGERVVRLEPGETKNDEGRTIFMAPELYDTVAIQKQLRDRYFPGCPWVFSYAGKPILNFGAVWESACKAARLIGHGGEPNKLLHDFRRTGVRNLVRAGAPEQVAMAISGDKTRAIFDRYNIVSFADLKDAARRPAKPRTIGTRELSIPPN
jgi:hypothetical protein